WPQDIRGSKAWVQALRRAAILSANEELVLLKGLDKVAERLADGAAMAAPDEDIHTLVERLLYQEVGEVAGKLHTGRSRNDQVATDLRLWCLEALQSVNREAVELGRALVTQARAGIDLVMPGYTHGQRAQPVRFGFLLLAHAWPLVRDRRRLAEISHRVAELPLGSGALAGSGIRVDRDYLRHLLGFRVISGNALDATGDRDFVAEILFALALLATHLSRLGAELVALSSTEYRFVRLADGYCTGSSLMPQKRNPDIFELARAKAGRTLGDLVALLTTLKGLPAGYSKDLQEDKAALFDAVDTLLLTLPAVRGAVATLKPVPERMRLGLDVSMLATDLADGLVGQGVPFREAHTIVGRLVRLAEEQGKPLNRVPDAAARVIHPKLPRLIAGLGTWEDSIERRATPGGSSRAAVLDQIRTLESEFNR
ncbi:MAG: argininosuccinate lyase, partial [Gemmatimonadetes bacterium]|nr:argininosuccinate lyase [Gemmatimonadota bacterium]